VNNRVTTALPARTTGNKGTHGVFVNVFYDIDLTKFGLNATAVPPFVGGGIGALWTHFASLTSVSSNDDMFRLGGTGANFVYQEWDILRYKYANNSLGASPYARFDQWGAGRGLAVRMRRRATGGSERNAGRRRAMRVRGWFCPTDLRADAWRLDRQRAPAEPPAKALLAREVCGERRQHPGAGVRARNAGVVQLRHRLMRRSMVRSHMPEGRTAGA